MEESIAAQTVRQTSMSRKKANKREDFLRQETTPTSAAWRRLVSVYLLRRKPVKRVSKRRSQRRVWR